MELIVDNFAGGGGASTGIELATGRSVGGNPLGKARAAARHNTRKRRGVHDMGTTSRQQTRPETQGADVP